MQGYTKREGWSTEPIDLSGLGAADADAKLSVGRLLYQDIKVGQSQLTVSLKNKVLKTNFEDIQLYGGHATSLYRSVSTPLIEGRAHVIYCVIYRGPALGCLAALRNKAAWGPRV